MVALGFRRWNMGTGARAEARFGFSPLGPPLGNENPLPGEPVSEKEIAAQRILYCGKQKRMLFLGVGSRFGTISFV